MPKRPFLVLNDGTCVPLEGDYRVEQVEGDWYVLGQNSVVACGSRHAAERMLAQLLHEHDAHALAEEALESLPTIYGIAD